MKHLRKILFPFAAIYYVIMQLRNKCYDWGLFSSKKYELPIICIGNISTGGTGKTPMTEYLIRLLNDTYNVATLSRGYGRKTKGYRNVKPSNLAQDVGDEPLQFARKFSDIDVAVSESRQLGVETLMAQNKALDVILLDDAFQHRKVTAGFQVLLTPYNDLYADDYLLPAGNLRESRSGAQRANTVIVTKCPETLSKKEQSVIKEKLDTRSNQSVYFTSIAYGSHLQNERDIYELTSLDGKKITVVTGIANPTPFVNYLKDKGLDFEHKAYGDHHNFALSELKMLEDCEVIITTEKDYVRLNPAITHSALYYLPIEVRFLEGKQHFDAEIMGYMKETC